MTPEIKALLEKAHQSQLAAESLKEEGYLDFAASRAYYAMFYAAQALLLSRGLSFSSHTAVIAAFGKEFAKTGDMDTKFHRWLIDAQDLRISGDYDIDSSISEAQVRKLLEWTQEFLEAAKSWLSSA
ncbi:MAG: HEPN domain-containing protein [Anaerolineales bacterium]|jgi:uncharacterized protein (UPF0332 family)